MENKENKNLESKENNNIDINEKWDKLWKQSWKYNRPYCNESKKQNQKYKWYKFLTYWMLAFPIIMNCIIIIFISVGLKIGEEPWSLIALFVSIITLMFSIVFILFGAHTWMPKAQHHYGEYVKHKWSTCEQCEEKRREDKKYLEYLEEKRKLKIEEESLKK